MWCRVLQPHLRPLWRGCVRGATKKAGGSSRNGRKSPGQRLGVKTFGGCASRRHRPSTSYRRHPVEPGNVLVKQRGTKFYPGENVARGRDDTLYALATGRVVFTSTGRRVGSRGDWKYRRYVNVFPPDEAGLKGDA